MRVVGLGGPAALFLLLAFCAYLWPRLPGDLEISLALQRFTPYPLALLLEGVSWLGERPVALATLLFCVATLGLLRFKMEALIIALALAPTLINIPLKELIGRPRPSPELITVLDSGSTEFSFPSGHVLHCVVFFGILIYLAPKLIPNLIIRRSVQATMAAMILLVGPSRVYLGAHWPSDVLGSYLLGSLYLGLLIAVYNQWGPPPVAKGSNPQAIASVAEGEREG
ncbi:MAG: phosphoesterase PA-phosphatase related protein [Dehalococcoidia bacterium]|nr:phosphoesterase PA-phosphatase related protein [Dehalococcoidia bacterium]